MHVHVNARRWFQRTYGNTYHTVSLTVNLPDAHDVPGAVLTIGPSDVTYGYGTHYLHTAGVMLAEAGLLPMGDETDPHRAAYDLHAHTWRREHGITLTEDVADVPRRKDLHH